jgi:hypothetical protein
VSSRTASTSSASPTAATTTDDATTSKTLKKHSDTRKLQTFFYCGSFWDQQIDFPAGNLQNKGS